MSWSASGIAKKEKDENPSIVWDQKQLQSGHGERESAVALERVEKAVLDLLALMTLGYGEFKVRVYGHANPGNIKAPGYVNDSLSINIDQK